MKIPSKSTNSTCLKTLLLSGRLLQESRHGGRTQAPLCPSSTKWRHRLPKTWGQTFLVHLGSRLFFWPHNRRLSTLSDIDGPDRTWNWKGLEPYHPPYVWRTSDTWFGAFIRVSVSQFVWLQLYMAALRCAWITKASSMQAFCSLAWYLILLL